MVGLAVGCAEAQLDITAKPVAAPAPQRTATVAVDLKALIQAEQVRSSGAGATAFERAVRRWNLRQATREEILRRIGPPTEVRRRSMFYRFDSGLGGWAYVFEIDRDGRVTALRRTSLE